MKINEKVSGTTSSTTAYLIYKTLKESDNPILKLFDIGFPSEDCLALETNSIFIRELDEKFENRTNTSDIYLTRTEISIVTKKSDYLEVSKLLRSLRRIIRSVLLDNKQLAVRRRLMFIETKNIYNSKFALKAASILVETREIDNYELEDHDHESLHGLNLDVKIK